MKRQVIEKVSELVKNGELWQCYNCIEPKELVYYKYYNRIHNSQIEISVYTYCEGCVKDLVKDYKKIGEL